MSSQNILYRICQIYLKTSPNGNRLELQRTINPERFPINKKDFLCKTPQNSLGNIVLHTTVLEICMWKSLRTPTVNQFFSFGLIQHHPNCFDLEMCFVFIFLFPFLVYYELTSCGTSDSSTAFR